MDRDEFEFLGFGCGALGVIVAVLVVLGLGGFLLNSYLNQHVYQPVQRQNLNHDADWLRSKTEEVTNLWHDFQNAQTAETADVTQIHQYVKAHGDPATWQAWDPRAQAYQQMMLKYNGDYQAEVTDAQQYNADRDNPDYKTVWDQPELAPFPQTLDAGPQPQL